MKREIFGVCDDRCRRGGLPLPRRPATFTPTFDTPSFPGTQFTVTSDPAYNVAYSVNFGITVDNAYLYLDSRDTFDGVGIANGTVAEIGTEQAGRIDFLDTTNFVTIDYLALQTGIYNAYGLDRDAPVVVHGKPGQRDADPGRGHHQLCHLRRHRRLRDGERPDLQLRRHHRRHEHGSSVDGARCPPDCRSSSLGSRGWAPSRGAAGTSEPGVHGRAVTGRGNHPRPSASPT